MVMHAYRMLRLGSEQPAVRVCPSRHYSGHCAAGGNLIGMYTLQDTRWLHHVADHG